MSGKGTPVKNADAVLSLLDTVMLAKEVAAVLCRGHQKGSSLEAEGNTAADLAAR